MLVRLVTDMVTVVNSRQALGDTMHDAISYARDAFSSAIEIGVISMVLTHLEQEGHA